jgi:hypothetical protein
MNSLLTKIGIWTGIGVLVASVVTLSWLHYTSLIDAKVALSAQVKTLEQDLETEKATTAHYRDKVIAFNAAAMAQVKALEDFGKIQEASGSYDREVKDVQAKHDLGALASKKPGLIEARVNAGSARVLRLLEQATEPPASASK